MSETSAANSGTPAEAETSGSAKVPKGERKQNEKGVFLPLKFLLSLFRPPSHEKHLFVIKTGLAWGLFIVLIYFFFPFSWRDELYIREVIRNEDTWIKGAKAMEIHGADQDNPSSESHEIKTLFKKLELCYEFTDRMENVDPSKNGPEEEGTALESEVEESGSRNESEVLSGDSSPSATGDDSAAAPGAREEGYCQSDEPSSTVSKNEVSIPEYHPDSNCLNELNKELYDHSAFCFDWKLKCLPMRRIIRYYSGMVYHVLRFLMFSFMLFSFLFRPVTPYDDPDRSFGVTILSIGFSKFWPRQAKHPKAKYKRNRFSFYQFMLYFLSRIFVGLIYRISLCEDVFSLFKKSYQIAGVFFGWIVSYHYYWKVGNEEKKQVLESQDKEELEEDDSANNKVYERYKTLRSEAMGVPKENLVSWKYHAVLFIIMLVFGVVEAQLIPPDEKRTSDDLGALRSLLCGYWRNILQTPFASWIHFLIFIAISSLFVLSYYFSGRAEGKNKLLHPLSFVDHLFNIFRGFTAYLLFMSIHRCLFVFLVITITKECSELRKSLVETADDICDNFFKREDNKTPDITTGTRVKDFIASISKKDINLKLLTFYVFFDRIVYLFIDGVSLYNAAIYHGRVDRVFIRNVIYVACLVMICYHVNEIDKVWKKFCGRISKIELSYIYYPKKKDNTNTEEEEKEKEGGEVIITEEFARKYEIDMRRASTIKQIVKNCESSTGIKFLGYQINLAAVVRMFANTAIGSQIYPYVTKMLTGTTGSD